MGDGWTRRKKTLGSEWEERQKGVDRTIKTLGREGEERRKVGGSGWTGQ